MAETRRKFDRDFKEGAVRLARETGRPVAEVARDPGINEGTLGNWVNTDKRRRGDGTGELGEDERAELARLRKENAELAIEVMCLSAVSPSGSRTRWAGSGGGLIGSCRQDRCRATARSTASTRLCHRALVGRRRGRRQRCRRAAGCRRSPGRPAACRSCRPARSGRRPAGPCPGSSYARTPRLAWRARRPASACGVPELGHQS